MRSIACGSYRGECADLYSAPIRPYGPVLQRVGQGLPQLLVRRICSCEEWAVSGWRRAISAGVALPLVFGELKELAMENARYVGWRKSSYSDGNGDCVEIGSRPGSVGVRDTKQDGRGPVLEFTQSEWEAFVRGVKNGEFDL
jgi:hypothetical protein